ncbi:hypothetical protein QTI73_15360 [Clostridium perfringens]|nr:hypothetical protein [Clostridium perfringens]
MKINDDIIQVIDYLVNAISNGKYLYYQVSYIPETKLDDKEFLNRLDTKIREKYQTNKTKSERLNLRRRNMARFLAVRYKHILILLKTEGASEIGVNEKWEDIIKQKIELKISKYTSYLIGLGVSKKQGVKHKTLPSKVTVTLSNETYNLIKMSCIEAIRVKKSIPLLLYEWNKINGFNGWSGINLQKQQLRDYLANEVCRNFGMKKKEARKLFRVNTFRAKAQKSLDKAFLEEATENRPNGPPVVNKGLQV